MKILALEWLSCHAEAVGANGQELEPTLLDEGLAMLAVLVEGLVAGGHDVSTCLSPTAMKSIGLEWKARGVNVTRCDPVVGKDVVDASLDQWEQLANTADLVWLVAPELDSILQLAIGRLRLHTQLLSCTPPMLDFACDKWLAAAAFLQKQVKHPTTRLLSEMAPNEPPTYPRAPIVAKRRDGAGGEGTQLLRSYSDLEKLLAAVDDHQAWIVQPWIVGQSYSLSAFIGPHGTAWLHPVKQEVIATEGRLAYHGATLAAKPPNREVMIETAERAINSLGNGAIGWVGIDLLYSDNEQAWYVIEVNPRLTSSVSVLADSHDGNLIHDLLGYCVLGDDRIAASNACPNMIIRLD